MPHQQAPQTLSQLLFREKLPTTTDNVTLTIEPTLQKAAWQALTATPGNNDGAVVVLHPKTGAVLAMVSNPTYDPNALASTSLQAEHLAYLTYTAKDHEGFFPLRPIATSEILLSRLDHEGRDVDRGLQPQAFAGGLRLSGPALPELLRLEPAALQRRESPSDSVPCGGTMTSMLPESCDPGYAELGVQEGSTTLRQQAELFGINSVPPIDLPAVGQQPIGGVIAVDAADAGAERAGPARATRRSVRTTSRTPRCRTRWSRPGSPTAA